MKTINDALIAAITALNDSSMEKDSYVDAVALCKLALNQLQKVKCVGYVAFYDGEKHYLKLTDNDVRTGNKLYVHGDYLD